MKLIKGLPHTGNRCVLWGCVMLLSSCATISPSPNSDTASSTSTSGASSHRGLSALASSAVNIPEVSAVGVIPPPPSHTWSPDKEDVFENQANNNGLVSIPAMEGYLNQLYQKAKQLADVPEWPGKVYVSSDTSINAHSSAAGNIYINIAVLQSAESEDEIFAVITHEFGHVYLNHQAAYRSKLMTGSGVFFGRAAIAFATRNLGGAGWTMGDTLSILGTITDGAIIPTWEREVEQQADRFGVTLSLKGGYSYPAGFKTFLERLALVERAYNQKLAAKKKVVADNKAAENQKAQQGNWDIRTSYAMRSAGDEAAEKLIDKLGLNTDNEAKNHDDAEIREKTLTEEVRAVLKGPRVRLHDAPWKEITKNKSVSEVFAHFNLLPKVDELAQAHRLTEAIKLANVMASGTTATDGTADITLFNLLHEENRLSLDAQLAILLRNQNSLHRSWAAQVLAAKWMATKNPEQARLFIEKQFEYFEKAPRTVPDMIGFYTDSMKSPVLAASLNLPCIASNPRYRKACIDRAQTEESRAKIKAFQDGKEDAILKNFQDRLDKTFGHSK